MVAGGKDTRSVRRSYSVPVSGPLVTGPLELYERFTAQEGTDLGNPKYLHYICIALNLEVRDEHLDWHRGRESQSDPQELP